MEDYQLAPFHILATEGAVHIDKTHQWHMAKISRICQADTAIFRETPYKIVDTNDEKSIEAVVQWWLNLTESGGEGMVVKPNDFIT